MNFIQNIILNNNLLLLMIYLLINFSINKIYVECAWTKWDRNLQWWQKTVLYQIYPCSFKDTNGDGYGDLKGIIEKLDHLSDAGIDTFWLGPIYRSPMIEGGYDISNFTDVNPLFGTLDDFKTLMDEATKRDMNVIMDFVPNHTSDEHEWFQKSIKRIDPYTDYYIWNDGKLLPDGNRTYPNNWISVFGGHAWTWNDERQQYYFHQFVKKQPDLNYRNRKVIEDMKKQMKFWLDLGVDGFRVDAANHIVEDKELRDEPYKPGKEDSEVYDDLIHLYTRDQPETYDVVYEYRQFLEDYKLTVLEKHDRIMITEAYTDIDNLMKYYTNGTKEGAHTPFNFLLMDYATVNSNATDYDIIIHSWLDNMPEGHWLNWVAGNHDNHRVATRMGSEMVDAFYMLTMLLPGTAVVYQGEEIGQEDNNLRKDQIRDKNNIKGGIVMIRDPPRGPFLWDDTENAGFTKANIPWEPIHPSYWENNLQSQKTSKEKTHYQVYKSIINLRKTSTIQRGYLNTYVVSDWVFAFSRELPGYQTYIVVINVGSERELVTLRSSIPLLPEVLCVIISSVNSGYENGERVTSKLTIHDKWKPLVLRPKASVVLIPMYNESLQDETTLPATTLLTSISTNITNNSTAAPNGTTHKSYAIKNYNNFTNILTSLSFLIFYFIYYL